MSRSPQFFAALLAACAVLVGATVLATGPRASDDPTLVFAGDPAGEESIGGTSIGRDLASPTEEARDTHRTEAPEEGFGLSAPNAVLRVRVVDHTGEPAPGKRVRLSYKARSHDELHGRFGKTRQTTNAAGWVTFTLDPSTPQQYPDLEAIVILARSDDPRVSTSQSVKVGFGRPARIMLPDPATLVPGSLKVVVRRSRSVAPSEPLMLELAGWTRVNDSKRRIPADLEWSKHEWTGVPPGKYALQVTSKCLPGSRSVAMLADLEVPPGAACVDVRLLGWDPLAEAKVARLDVTRSDGTRPETLNVSVRRRNATRLRALRTIQRWPVAGLLPHDEEVELTLRAPGSGITTVPGRDGVLAVALPPATPRTVRWRRTPKAPKGDRMLVLRRIPGKGDPPGTGWTRKLSMGRNETSGDVEIDFPCPGRYRVRATRGIVLPDVLEVARGSARVLEVKITGTDD